MSTPNTHFLTRVERSMFNFCEFLCSIVQILIVGSIVGSIINYPKIMEGVDSHCLALDRLIARRVDEKLFYGLQLTQTVTSFIGAPAATVALNAHRLSNNLPLFSKRADGTYRPNDETYCWCLYFQYELKFSSPNKNQRN